ncbi:MAG: XTP/dITP diphosphatase [Candidatus Margulisbacteria bacterium]|nr:XTP/dITP diphosphatase [Candidatus Margulisiibacteriota bacterium]
MEIVLASHNAHKVREVAAILNFWKVLSLKDIGYSAEIEETGKTFAQNALLKAGTIAGAINKIVLADDSGLEIKCLHGAPGIYSARYAGVGATKEMLCNKVLKEMEQATDRSAQFHCVMALVDPLKNISKTFEGIVKGQIIHEMKGQNGFGYDPIFFVPSKNKTMAEMSEQEKNLLSHRFRALEQVKIYIQEHYLGDDK